MGPRPAPVARTSEQAVLGEGLRWDAERGELLRVDILAGRVHRDRVLSDGELDPVAQYDLGGTVGAIAPVAGHDAWLLATGRGFAVLRPDGSLTPTADVAPDGVRMNDAACDPQGRMWAGTMADDQREDGGSLYCLDTDGCVDEVLDGLTISNGLGWSPDGTTMYLVDSGPRAVFAFDFDGEAGELAEPRVVVALPEELGAPDGLTVDADGDLWIAVYGGGRVQRYAPDGELREEWLLPAEQTTSCAFAGAGLHRLYVTTATEHWSDERRRDELSAGLVYSFETDATGRPAEPFRPVGDWWPEPD